MTWRWVWARSRITALVASGLVWLTAVALSPAFVAGYSLLGIVSVANWRTPALLWWRFGARRIEPAAAEAVWRALVPLEWLRGRNQPVVWAGRWVGQDIVAPDPHTVVLSEQLVRALSRHEVADRELRRLVVRAFALAQVNRSRTVAAVEIICLPWAILADIAGRVCGRWSARPLAVFSWKCRWLFIGLAGIELFNRSHWAGVVMLAITAAATVTTPRWNQAWNKRRAGLADNLERASLDAPSAGRREPVATHGGPRPSRPASSRDSR